jgi:predicted secreted protein
MRWTSMLAIWFLFCALSVFFVLPFGVRTAEEAGVARVPGQAESAPHDFRPGRTALRVVIVGSVLWGLFMLNYHFGWVTPQMIDVLDTWNDAAAG